MSEWIPCSAKMPPDFKDVLLAGPAWPKIYIGYWYPVAMQWKSSSYNFAKDSIDLWQELPELPLRRASDLTGWSNLKS